MAHTYDTETISKNIAYRKHIRDSEFETREFLEQETPNQNIENIVTRLDKTRLDNNQMTQSTDSSKHSENHEPEVKPDPEPSSSDFLESSSSDSRARKTKRSKKKSVASIGKMTHQTHLRAMILIRPMTVIIDVKDEKIRRIGKWIR